MSRMRVGAAIQYHRIGSWICGILCSALATGCISDQSGTQPSPYPALISQLPSATDESWPAAKYAPFGMPDPERFWTAADYRDCREALMSVYITNRAALPRFGSEKSGAVFGRMTNPTNTAVLGETNMPTQERIRHFITILNRMPSLRDVYAPDAREPVLHAESIEIDHAFLRMLGNAVKWDNKQLPPAAGEKAGVHFRLAEVSRTPIESLLGINGHGTVVPRGDRFYFVGAQASATSHSMLRVLGDGGGLSEKERLRSIHYLREDMPALWRHISKSQQRELLDEMSAVLEDTKSTFIHQELDALRRQLDSK